MWFAAKVNKITKYNPTTFTYEDETTYKYGDSYTHTIYHPTKTAPNGASTSATERTDKFTAYYYQGSEYLTDTESAIYKMLFGNNKTYWLASRGVFSFSDDALFGAFDVFDGYVDRAFLCGGYSYKLGVNDIARGVRPIVYLKSNIQTSAKDASGAWIISE